MRLSFAVPYILIFLYLCKLFYNRIYYRMTNISLKRIQLRQLSFLRKRRRYNLIHKRIRIIRACRPRHKNKRYRYSDSKEYHNSLPRYIFDVPDSFNLYEFPENVIRFINETKDFIRNLNYKCRAEFNLQQVTSIDNGGIGMLLSLINFLARHRVQSFGNSPISEEAQKLFINSGFFDHVKMIQGKKAKSNDVFIIQSGASTNPSGISSESRKIMKHLMGIENTSYKPVYSLIGEIVSNSVEHANLMRQDKNWLLSVHYEQDKVKIMVLDIGLGILATLKKKLHQSLKDLATLISDIQTLFNLFDKKYQSSTFESNRNKGLPKIKLCYDNNFISNLTVITNGVLLDFSGERSKKLEANFQGTYYYWEVSRSNIEKWQNRAK